MTSPAPSAVARQLRAVLPDLREALDHGWRLRPVLSAAGLDRRLLHYLEHLGAVTATTARPGKRRGLRWTWTGTDADLVGQLLTFPAYRYPRWRSTAARYVRLARARRCARCNRAHARGALTLKVHQGTAAHYLCPACVRPEDLPLHERELADLLAELRRLTLLWPQELPVYAARLRNVGQLLRATVKTAPRRAATSALLQLGHDLVEVGDWLAAAERKLLPHRRHLLEYEVAEVAVDPPPYQLAEVVAEDPRPYRPGRARAAVEQTLRDRARAQQRRRSADLVHYGLIHATSWLRDLQRRLEERHLHITSMQF